MTDVCASSSRALARVKPVPVVVETTTRRSGRSSRSAADQDARELHLADADRVNPEIGARCQAFADFLRVEAEPLAELRQQLAPPPEPTEKEGAR